MYTYYHKPQRHYQLNSELDKYRDTFAGIGTRKAKAKLNKNPEMKAKILRKMMEIEDINIRAKKYIGDWSERLYAKKETLIHELAEDYLKNNLVFGIVSSFMGVTEHIIYFELEGEQISWHCNCELTLPEYPKKWDEQPGTYAKLERIYIFLIQ